MEWTVRPARLEDAEGISRTVVAALRETNARDYSEAVIARVEQSFSAVAVRALLERRLAFVAVAVAGDAVVGTASLDGHVVRTVFVAPSWQSRGIGRTLVARIVEAALRNGVTALAVPSSVTAKPFYARLGFIAIRDNQDGDERTIVMERRLTDA